MSDPSLVDHLLAVAFAIALPLWGWLSFPRVRRRLAEDRPGVRVRLYRRTMLWQWSAAAIVIGSWIGQGRSLKMLGFAWPGTIGTWVALAIVIAVMALMSTQLASVARRTELHDPVFEQLERAAPFLPRTRREYSWFLGTALTAGVCEELMFRGFLIAYVAVWIGAWPAVFVTALAFGLGHAYQGRGGAIKTTIAGIVGGSLYVLGGAIWLPMILHAFVDVHGGTVYRIVGKSRFS